MDATHNLVIPGWLFAKVFWPQLSGLAFSFFEALQLISSHRTFKAAACSASIFKSSFKPLANEEYGTANVRSTVVLPPASVAEALGC